LRWQIIGFSWRRVRREGLWTLTIAFVMVIGLTGLIVVPSVSTSLESGVQDYANAAATYIVVSNNYSPFAKNITLPPAVLEQIASIKGVQAMYPIDVNFTYFLYPPQYGGHIAKLGFPSAVVGGPSGFPPQLITLEGGALPESQAPGFLMNADAGPTYTLNESARVQIANVNFTAREVGVSNYVPVLGDNLVVLWDQSYVKAQLGPALFNTTFGKGTSFVVIKTDTVQDVEAVVQNLGKVLSPYQDFVISYDQPTVANLLSLENGTAPLYDALGIASLAFAMGGVIAVTNVAITRRSWEPGLVLTQGWNYRDVTVFFLCYFLIISTIALAVSIMLSYVISRLSGVQYEVYGGNIFVPVSPSSEFVIASIAVSISLPFLAALFVSWKVRRKGLDSVLREF
jgi:ABC-type lipoprotein release transport system permease subunit